MHIYTTITPKFQVHIPVAIRQQIGLKHHGKAIIQAERSKIIIQPIKSSILSQGGAFRVSKPIPAEKIRDYIDYANGKG